MPLSPAARADLLNRLSRTSATMMRHYLHHRDLRAASSARLDDQAERFLEHVDSGALASDDARTFCLDFHESNQKRVFMYDVSPAHDHRAIVDALKASQPASRAACSVAHSDTPKLAYHFVTDDEVRLVFTERHRAVKVDYRAMSVDPTTVDKTVVMSLDRRSRVLRLMFDLPERFNPHGDRFDDYYEHFELQAPALLSVGITPVELEPHVRRLHQKPHISIGKLRSSHVDARITIAPQGVRDVRHTAGYAEHERRVTNRLGGEYIWVSARADGPPTGAPLRDIRVNVNAIDNSITFRQHTLGVEIDYVLADLLS